MPEKNYLAIAKKSVSRPKDKVGWRKLLVYARNKKGKTYFSLSAGVERTLVLDPEDGTDTMKKLNPYRWPITRWEDMADAYGALRTGKLSPSSLGLGTSRVPFDWVSVDGLTRINNYALHYIRHKREEANLETRPGTIDRRDYFKSGELMKQMLAQFHTLPMNVVYTCQERSIGGNSDDEDEEETVLHVPELPQGVRGSVNSLVEVIGRLYVATAEFKNPNGGLPIEKKQRRLWIGLHDKFDTGYRSDYALPDFVRNPTIPKLVSLMLEGEV